MQTAKIEVKDNDLIAALRHLGEKILSLETIDAILVPRRHPNSSMVMPTLASDPDQLAGMDPLAPAFALNAAKVVSRLTRVPSGNRLVVMLRPCEIRALVELVKLNQGSMDELVIIGTDCLGAMGNTDYLKFAETDPPASTHLFYRSVLQSPEQPLEGTDLATACQACEHPLADGADLSIMLYGVDTQHLLIAQAQSDKGKALLSALAYPPADMPADRTEAVAKLVRRRTDFRDQMFQTTAAATANLERLSTYLAACVNCYNCRVACPVCYCRECVFVTDVFEHDPMQYLAWSRRKGALKMPTDTLFYHLTRLAHMSTACVGCGQCSNACPNQIPVMQLFRTIAHLTQAAFDYRAGADINQKPPLTEFKEREFEDIVGI